MTETQTPRNWEKIKLGDKLSLEYGKGLPAKDRKKGQYPVYGSNGMVGDHNEFLVEGPGIIVGRKGTIGAIVWADKNFWPIDTTYFVNLKDKNINLKWLYYKLNSLKLSRLNAATGTPGLNRDMVCSQVTLFPTNPLEQKSIAEILSSIDDALAIKERERQSVERLKVGVMKKLFDMREWKRVKLSETIEFVKGKKPQNMIKEKKQGYVPYLSTEYLRESRGADYVSLDENNILVEEGDVILLWDGSNAGEFFEGKKGVLSTTMVKFKIKTSQIDKKYLFYFLKTREKYLQGQTKGTGIPHVDRRVLLNIDIPLPSLEEQKRIAKILSSLDSKLSLQVEQKEKLERVKQGLMNELLTGKKRVKVN